MAIYIWWNEVNNIYVGTSPVDEVYVGTTKVRPSSTPPVSDDYLCFTSLYGDNTLTLNADRDPYPVNLEISWDKTNWIDYTIWTTIHFANANDKLYWRNKSTTPTAFSTGYYADYYYFSTGNTFAVSWDVDYLLCKTSTTNLLIDSGGSWDFIFHRLFKNCDITTPPRLPATTLSRWCYEGMFIWCQNLAHAPELPATELTTLCYSGMFQSSSVAELPAIYATSFDYDSCQSMFAWCSNIKLSETQTGEYQTPYRLPMSWTWEWSGAYPFNNMFYGTWWTFTWTPDINTTYYTSNTVV